MADDTKPVIPSAPPTGANTAATPHATATPAARPAPPKPAAAAPADIAGKTTTAASPGGAAAAKVPAAKPATATAAGRDPDDTSPLLTRRAWIGLSWGVFSAASAAALAATGAFRFPNVLNEPRQQFKPGFPNGYGMGGGGGVKKKLGSSFWRRTV